MRAKDFWIQLVLLLALGAAAAFGQTTIGATPKPLPKCVGGAPPVSPCDPTPADWAPKIVSAQLVMDPVQQKAYPENAWIKPCGPDNHDDACMDPARRHITNRIYGSDKARCEQEEGVPCEDLWMGGPTPQQYWVPIGKPVFYDETDGAVATTKPLQISGPITTGRLIAGKEFQQSVDVAAKNGRIVKLSDDEYEELESYRQTVRDMELRIAKAHNVVLEPILLHKGSGTCLTSQNLMGTGDFMHQNELTQLFSHCDTDEWQSIDRFEYRGQFLLVNVPEAK